MGTLRENVACACPDSGRWEGSGGRRGSGGGHRPPEDAAAARGLPVGELDRQTVGAVEHDPGEEAVAGRDRELLAVGLRDDRCDLDVEVAGRETDDVARRHVPFVPLTRQVHLRGGLALDRHGEVNSVEVARDRGTNFEDGGGDLCGNFARAAEDERGEREESGQSDLLQCDLF